MSINKNDTDYEYIIAEHNKKLILIGAYVDGLQRDDKAKAIGLQYCALTANTKYRAFLIWKLRTLKRIPINDKLTITLTNEDRINYSKYRKEQRRLNK
jgi:hypothetical protein